MDFFEPVFWENAQDVHRPIPGLVSVVICCRNGENYLREAIASILDQTYSRYEIVLIDNDSEDSTPAIAAEYPQIRYFCHENRGHIRSRNRGIQESRGEYLVFLDHDDRLLPNALEDGVRSFSQHQDCGFVFGRCCMIRADGSLNHFQSFKFSQRYADSYDYATLLIGSHYISPLSSVLFRREVLVAVGGIDPSAGVPDDDEVYLRISRQYPIYFHRAFVTEYRAHSSSQVYNKMRQLRLDVRRVLKAQEPYVKDNAACKKALRRGRLTCEYGCTIGSMYNIVEQVKRGNWSSALRLGLSILQFPVFGNCLVICLLIELDRRKFERSQPAITSSLEFVKWLAESESQSTQTAALQKVGVS